MITNKLLWQLAMLASCLAHTRIWAQTVPFSLQGPGIDASDFHMTAFASGLNFPVGMTELADGSILVAVSNGSSFFGSSSGSLIRLADTTGDGVADVEQTLVDDVAGGKLTSVRRAGDVVAVIGQGQDVPISLYRTGAQPSDPLTLTGSLRLTYPGGSWLHPHSALAMRESPGIAGQFELYFQLGSKSNFAKTNQTVTLGGLGLRATLAGDALHRIILRDEGSNLVATEHHQIATGLRNASGLVFDPNNGDLYIAENGIDGLVNVNEPHSADELNVIVAADLGGPIEDFGFPDTYEEYRTGSTVGSTGIAPLVSYQPLPSPDGREAEGINDIVMAPPAFPAAAQGVFAGFHGIFSRSGLANEENPVVLSDPASGAFFHFIGNDETGVGHLDGLLSTDDTLYLADLSPQDGFVSRAGVIYAIRAVGAVIAGDYNHNGTVTGADYTVWRDSLGQSGEGLPADGNGDFEINASDYVIWKANFGKRAASATVVPEPTSLAWLLLLGAQLRCDVLRRRRT